MRVFITGMTGTLGTKLAQLHHEKGDYVFGCARNQTVACAWVRKYPGISTLFTVDCKNLIYRNNDIGRLLPSMDVVYHCAAMKHVDLCEKNPGEAIVENAFTTGLIAEECHEVGVNFVLASTDKACLPTGVYGATKLLAEKFCIDNGGCAVRLGNLIGSSGSVFEKWQHDFHDGNAIKLTHPDMTRYFIPVTVAAQFMMYQACQGYVIIPPGMNSVRMGIVADRIVGNHKTIIGLRPGETMHQWLVAPGDRLVYEDHRIIISDTGEVVPAGANSQTAPRWDINELLAHTGINL